MMRDAYPPHETELLEMLSRYQLGLSQYYPKLLKLQDALCIRPSLH